MNQFDPRYMQLLVSKLERIIKKEQTVVSVAQELSVSRQTVHKHLLRYKRFGEDGIRRAQTVRRHKQAHNRTTEALERCVIELARRYVADGAETLADRLQYEYNTTLHPTTIYRILKRNNVRYTEYYVATKKRWKKQLFSHQVPGQELQMDTKYPYGYKQGKVIYTIIDDATRWAFVWSYATANAENTEDFVKRVIERAPFTIQKIRTDQGTEFVNLKLKILLEENNIAYRKNTPYCPEENGKIERFHGTLNQKALRYGFYPSQTLDQMQYKLNLFMHYYNYQKKHRGLGMDGKTPMERLNELASVNLTLQCHMF
ncbi:transposase [Candidatus Parcubacteria bacterium]|nr:transposase [Candidatus Parcubacteria bacterium]